MTNQSEFKVTFNGNGFSTLMRKEGISKKEMANILGCSISSIEKYMVNSFDYPRRSPDMSKLKTIASTLKCEVEDLYLFE